MSLITIVIILFCIGKLIDSARIKAQNKQIERVRAEQKRAQEWQRAKAREDAEIAKEVARVAKEQERIAKEQAKQAAQLAKHEEEITKLKNKMKNCEKTVANMRQRIQNLEDLYKIASKELEEATNAGDDPRREKALRKIIVLDNQLNAAHERSRKAKQDWRLAQTKLSA